eukprot:GSA25T00023917001.1
MLRDSSGFCKRFTRKKCSKSKLTATIFHISTFESDATNFPVVSLGFVSNLFWRKIPRLSAFP